ncbi:MAG: hypothetical protein U0531_17945 [Dehalococcoidia bacterium]
MATADLRLALVAGRSAGDRRGIHPRPDPPAADVAPDPGAAGAHVHGAPGEFVRHARGEGVRAEQFEALKFGKEVRALFDRSYASNRVQAASSPLINALGPCRWW